jgi:DNA repair exonuclease SbcCD ATPase subunit
MTFVDRTNEFKLITSSLSNDGKISQKQLQTTNNKNIKNSISVNKVASQIAHEIFVTSAKLEELTKLSKSKSPFGDPGDKIQELTFDIKGDLNSIRQKIEQLEGYVKTQSTINNQTKNHSETLVGALQFNLFSTTKAFTEALEVRTKNLKTLEERREKLTGTRRTGPSPVFQPAFDMYDKSGEDNDDDEISIAVPLLETQDDLIVQRTQAVQEVEKHIMEIREMFQKLANLVSLQSEQIKRIEDNIDDVSINAHKAHQSLLTYLPNVLSNRKLIVNVFLVLAFFIFLFFFLFL